MDAKTNMLEQANARLTNYLVQKKMRKTPERYEVMRVAIETEGLFTIDELGERMAQHGAFRVSRATLFNVLDVLVDAQIVVKHTVARAAKYEANMEQRPLICLTCQICGMVEKIENPALEEILAKIKSKKVTVHQRILYLNGNCRKCDAARRKKEREAKMKEEEKNIQL